MADHGAPTVGTRSFGAVCAWLLAIALLIFLCVWPLWAGMLVSNDDLKFVRVPTPEGSVGAALRTAWNSPGTFRPLEILVAAGCDEVTLACPPVLPVQIAGLLALAAGVVLLTRRLAPAHPGAAPLVLIWIAVSPATTVSLWQMDTCSQTWAAALAIWAGLLIWRALDTARAGRVDWACFGALLLIFAVGVSIKEIFYGWSAGLGTALILALIALWRADAAAARRALVLLVPVVVLPIAHLLIRLKFSGFSAAGGGDERYAVSLGGNLVLNAAVSLGGVFANGPLHLLNDDDASALLRMLPLISMVAGFCVVCAALGFRFLNRGVPGAVRMMPLLLASGAAILSLSVTLPMGSVSELYGFGANVGAGLLIVGAIISLWFPAAADERAIGRSLAAACAAVLLLVGLDGLASRAYHFGVTWQYTRDLNVLIQAHQRTLPPGTLDPIATVYWLAPCLVAKQHSQYVMAPMQTIGTTDFAVWMNHRDPQRHIIFTPEIPSSVRPGIDLVLDCSNLPQRGHW